MTLVKMTKHIRVLTMLLFVLLAGIAAAQTTEGTPKEADEFAKKKPETKLTEVIPTDSMAAAELLKRAVNWIKVESPKYKKLSGTTTSSKAECTASFPVKPKELNPEVDYTGKITMKVVIECKDSKYRYTVSDIKHLSKNGRTTAGSIDNEVPECGSMAMHDLVWKKLKGEALTDAAQVVLDLKAGMSQIATDTNKDEW
jgi:hypothetical protein